MMCQKLHHTSPTLKMNYKINFCLHLFTGVQIEKIVKSLTMATGSDNYYIYVEICYPFVIPYVTYIVDNCLLATCWKTTVITP